MQGIIFSLVAGAFISLQSVFNTKVSTKIGLWETNAVVHGVGCLTSLLILLMMREGYGSFHKITEVNKLYLLGGVFGAVIVFCVMKGVTLIGPAYSVSILMISQLLVALLIDTFGWFGVEKVPFYSNKLIGLAMLIAGVIVFKWK
ncbi:DMT family transporter [Brevibacillus dissolubilis]|uniref:DMT family transporter n=1 Tax=Brevibacillus dissolubilis TaxID=1844116 RepID=UPI0011172738|nr:DMT family transporter [Brevibacillus dissolubilis]